MLVSDLMAARRAVKEAKRAEREGELGAHEAMAAARGGVNAAKIALGERGPVWWRDGAPDLNRHMVHTTPYADWYSALSDGEPGPR